MNSLYMIFMYMYIYIYVYIYVYIYIYIYICELIVYNISVLYIYMLLYYMNWNLERSKGDKYFKANGRSTPNWALRDEI